MPQSESAIEPKKLRTVKGGVGDIWNGDLEAGFPAACHGKRPRVWLLRFQRDFVPNMQEIGATSCEFVNLPGDGVLEPANATSIF
jgi:hypothetical protein